MKGRLIAIMLVGLVVGLNLLSAVVLKEAANHRGASVVLVTALISLVVLINVLRVLFWGAIHKRYRLSDSYPLTSVFFPMILLLGWWYGEAVGLGQIIGTLLITAGVLLMMKDGAGGSGRNEESTGAV